MWQADRAGFGLPSNFSLFAAAVRLRCPDIRCTPINIADGEALPFDTTLSDFEGVTFPGSPPPNDALLRALDRHHFRPWRSAKTPFGSSTVS